MAKRKNNLPPAEDSLAQLPGQQRKLSSRFTAKDQFALPQRLVFLFIVLGVSGFGLFILYQIYVLTGSAYILAALVVFTFVVIMISIATLSKKKT